MFRNKSFYRDFQSIVPSFGTHSGAALVRAGVPGTHIDFLIFFQFLICFRLVVFSRNQPRAYLQKFAPLSVVLPIFALLPEFGWIRLCFRCFSRC